jgi:arylsulfatase
VDVRTATLHIRRVKPAHTKHPSELGKGATVTMTANGTKVAEGDLPKTIPFQISIGEGMDIGQDVGSAVDFTYKPPFQFTGKIDKVTVDLKERASGTLGRQ